MWANCFWRVSVKAGIVQGETERTPYWVAPFFDTYPFVANLVAPLNQRLSIQCAFRSRSSQGGTCREQKAHLLARWVGNLWAYCFGPSLTHSLEFQFGTSKVVLPKSLVEFCPPKGPMHTHGRGSKLISWEQVFYLSIYQVCILCHFAPLFLEPPPCLSLGWSHSTGPPPSRCLTRMWPCTGRCSAPASAAPRGRRPRKSSKRCAGPRCRRPAVCGRSSSAGEGFPLICNMFEIVNPLLVLGRKANEVSRAGPFLGKHRARLSHTGYMCNSTVTGEHDGGHLPALYIYI